MIYLMIQNVLQVRHMGNYFSFVSNLHEHQLQFRSYPRLKYKKNSKLIENNTRSHNKYSLKTRLTSCDFKSLLKKDTCIYHVNFTV